MTSLDADEYTQLLAFAAAYNTLPGIRIGQALFNALRQVNPATADRIHGTDADPFYDDRKIVAFWKAIA